MAGPVGQIEVALDWPDAASPLGVAHIAHPHPLYGGSLDNKVVSTLARAFCALGWLAVRSNFRGVGATEGQHDGGRGELADLLHLIEQVPWLPDPDGPDKDMDGQMAEWPMASDCKSDGLSPTGVQIPLCPDSREIRHAGVAQW